MPVSSTNSPSGRALVTGMLAVMPLLMCTAMGMSLRDAPALDRVGTVSRPLQFARYCVNHGRDPILHTSVLVSRFRFRNVGSSTIQLGEIERSCGCLTPAISHRELQPGEIGEMKVSVPLVEQSAGSHEFQLTVHYSDSQPRHETVLIKAVFPEPRVHVTPRAMEVSQQGASNQSVTHQFSITDHRAHPLQVTGVESSSEWVSGVVESRENDGAVTKIAMEIAGGIPEGTHRVLVQAVTDDAQFPAVMMPIRIQGPKRRVPVEVRPSMLRIHAADTDPHAVRMRIPESWEVSHVDCLPAELMCEWDTVDSTIDKNHRQVDLALKLSGPPASKTREGVVTLYANDSSEMLTMRVEIVGATSDSAETAATNGGSSLSSN